ncbi:MAG: tetratricopeptide repeat protein [Deltaproteobacteria bacterium]|nr:tetratricopeptide repeat protein [Deltaproteobacteria bacterium]
MHEYELVLKNDPYNYEASFALASLYSWDRRYHGRALDLYRRLYNRYPKNTEARLEMGRLLLERGEFDEAEKAYRDALALEPENADAHISLGKVYMGMKKNGEAETEFNKALEIEPGNVDAHYYLATLLSANPDRYGEAIDHAEKVVEKEPDNADIRLLLARLYSYETRYAQAAEHLQYLVENGNDDYEVYLELARAYNYAEDYDSAIAIYNKMAEKDPKDVTVRLELGQCYLAQGAYTDAIVNLEYVVETDPWNVDGRKGLARAYKESGKIDEAIDQYKRILVVNPGDEEARTFLALYDIYYSEGAFLDAFFNAPGPGGPGFISPGPPTLKMSEAEQKYRTQLANELYNKQAYQRARFEFEKLVAANPNNIYYRLALANIYRQSGMWRSALHQYKVAESLDPSNIDAQEGIALVTYESAPTLDVFAGYSEAIRFADRISYLNGGTTFTYRFWDGWSAWGRLEAARMMQQNQDAINILAPAVGLNAGLFGIAGLKGEYIYNIFDQDIDPTHNWLIAGTADILDIASLELAYQRKDVRQTALAMHERIFMDSYGGVLAFQNLTGADWDHFNLRGEYRYRIYSESDQSDGDHDKTADAVDLDSQNSDYVQASLGYTFFNPFEVDNSGLLVSYAFTWLDHEDFEPYATEAYWSPYRFWSHSLPIGWFHGPRDDFNYSLGASPGYGWEISQEGDDAAGSFGLGLFGSANWRINYNHALSAQAEWGAGGGYSDGSSYYSYSIFLNWRITFGDHSALE